MRHATTRLALAALGILALVTGCATPTTRGQSALASGRYDEAATQFSKALSDNPASADARLGLGISRYRLGAMDEAERRFTEVLAQSPDLPVAHLYLGLIALLRGQDRVAGERLRHYAMGAPPRLAGVIERTLQALGTGATSPALRQYMAAGIEDQAAWAGELAAAREALAQSDQRRITEDRTALTLPRACQCR
jgi:tetratricopeptide (TPR) repeat protein